MAGRKQPDTTGKSRPVSGTTKKGTDWVAVRLAYINGSMSLRDLADDFGIKAAGVMTRAAKEGWEDERKQKQVETSIAAQKTLQKERVEKLSEFNAQDVKIAEALKAKGAALLRKDSLEPRELASIARVFVDAQKIGLLALGAASEKVDMDHRSPDGSMSPQTVDAAVVSALVSKLID